MSRIRMRRGARWDHVCVHSYRDKANPRPRIRRFIDQRVRWGSDIKKMLKLDQRQRGLSKSSQSIGELLNKVNDIVVSTERRKSLSEEERCGCATVPETLFVYGPF